MKKYLVYLVIFCSLSVAFLSQSHALTMACTMEAKMCPDGETYVWRTWPNCEFAACPTTSLPSPGVSSPWLPSVGGSSSFPGGGGYACTEEAKVCADGTTVWRVGPNCEFMTCPSDDDTTSSDDDGVMCTMDAKICSDGSSVWRTWPSCEFAACPWETKPKACTREYNPVCGQPKQTNPLAGIAAPKTYSNKCVMESEGATLLNHGKCIGDFWPKVQQSLDDKIDQLIEKIETKLSSVAQKKSVVDKMILRLEAKIQDFAHLEWVIQYIKSRLEEYVSNL